MRAALAFCVFLMSLSSATLSANPFQEALELGATERKVFRCGKRFVTFVSSDGKRILTLAKAKIVVVERTREGSRVGLVTGAVRIGAQTHQALIDCLD